MLVLLFCISALAIKGVKGEVLKNNTVKPSVITNGDIVKCTPVPDKPPWCACKSSTSELVVDLSSLDSPQNKNGKIKTPRFIAETENGWYVAWSPCTDFDIFTNVTLNPSEGDKACHDAGFALFTNLSVKECQSFGPHKTSAKLIAHGLDGQLRITLFQKFNYNITHIAQIHLLCKEDSDSHIFKYVGERNGIQFATFTSTCCCEGGCSTSPTAISVYGRPNPWIIIGGSIAGGLVLVVLAFVARKKGWCKKQLPYPIAEQNQPDNERERLFFNSVAS